MIVKECFRCEESFDINDMEGLQTSKNGDTELFCQECAEILRRG